MKVAEIVFEDEALKACVLDAGIENAEDIKELVCRKQKIKSLKGIEYLTALMLVDFTRNDLTEVDLSKNTALEEIFLGNNAISHLDVSGCKNLTHLEVFMNDLEELDLSQNAGLEELYASTNDFKQLDLTANPALVDLRVQDNNLSAIQLTPDCQLSRLDIGGNSLDQRFVAHWQTVEKLALNV